MADFTAILVAPADDDADAPTAAAQHHHETFLREQRAIYASFVDTNQQKLQAQQHHVEHYRPLYRKSLHAARKKSRFPAAASAARRDITIHASSFGYTERSSLLRPPAIRTTLSSVVGVDSLPKSSGKRTDVRFFVYALAYVVFLAMGSIAFELLEGENELAERQVFRDVRLRFAQKYSNVIDDDLEEFIRQVTRINNHGVSPMRNATAADLNWSFGQALFFSGSIITTIGYGHITPLTQAGKLFCILYAIVGIPLTLVLLSASVQRLLVPVGWLLGGMQSRFGHMFGPFNIRAMHLLIIATICASLFLALPTAVFAHLEPNWSTVDSFYYCFMSLTTIGLGDYVPGDQPTQANRSLYKVAITAYLIVGLIAAMLCLTLYYDIPELNMGQLFSEQSAAAAAASAASGDCESTRLSVSGGRSPMCYSSGGGPSGLYIPQRDDEVRRSVVRIRPRGDESPSPEEEHAPMMIGDEYERR